MKHAIIAASLMALSTSGAFAQPSQAQGGGQTGPSGNAGQISGPNSAPGTTTGESRPYLGPEPVYPRGGAQVTGDPNGTANGPTTLSGTGPSTFGGNNPGAAR